MSLRLCAQRPFGCAIEPCSGVAAWGTVHSATVRASECTRGSWKGWVPVWIASCLPPGCPPLPLGLSSSILDPSTPRPTAHPLSPLRPSSPRQGDQPPSPQHLAPSRTRLCGGGPAPCPRLWGGPTSPKALWVGELWHGCCGLPSCMLSPRGGDRLGRCEGGRHVENSEHSEGCGEVHGYPAGQREGVSGRDNLGIAMLPM